MQRGGTQFKWVDLMKPYVLGIDPGSPLTMALLAPNGEWVGHAGGEVLADKAKVGWKNSPASVTALIRKWHEHAVSRKGALVAAVENVGPMPGEGIVSACKFAGSIWLVQGVLTAFNIPYAMITPQEWKRALKLSRDKDASVKLAKTVFAARAWRLKHKKDHDYAEAALLAHYYQQKLAKGD